MKNRRLRLTVLMFFAVDMLFGGTTGFHDGAPRSSCEELRPLHRPHEPQRTPNPYRVRFLDDVVDYRCGDTINSKTFVLESKDGSRIWEGEGSSGGLGTK